MDQVNVNVNDRMDDSWMFSEFSEFSVFLFLVRSDQDDGSTTVPQSHSPMYQYAMYLVLPCDCGCELVSIPLDQWDLVGSSLDPERTGSAQRLVEPPSRSFYHQ